MMMQIDLPTLTDLIGEDEDLLAELATIFSQSVADSVARMRAAIMDGNAWQLFEISHLFKGRLQYLAAQKLQEIAAQLELAGRQSDLTGAEYLLDELVKGVEEMLADLRILTNLSLETDFEE